jgi:hypothetical protein
MMATTVDGERESTSGGNSRKSHCQEQAIASRVSQNAPANRSGDQFLTKNFDLATTDAALLMRLL